jgi:3-hydroxyacyl-[acyl-carrier-protein] dehydratase
LKSSAISSLPHAYPFRFIDRLIELDSKKGIALKNISINEPLFQGHFKEEPVFPGVLIIEAMAELSGLVMNCGKTGKTMAYLAQIKDIKFNAVPAPGCQIVIESELEQDLSGIASFSVKARVGNNIKAEGRLILASA